MSKISKIIISILGIILGVGIVFGTLYYAYLNNGQNNIPGKGSEQNDMMPPQMRENQSEDNVTNRGRQKPNMNNNLNDEDNSNINNKDNTENGEINSEQPKEIPNENGNMPNDNGYKKGDIRKEMNNFNKPSINLSTMQIVIIGIGTLILTISIMYLIMSGFGSNSIFVSKDKILIFVLLNVIICAILTFGIVKIGNDKILNNVNNIVAVSDDGNITNTSVNFSEDYF